MEGERKGRWKWKRTGETEVVEEREGKGEKMMRGEGRGMFSH